MQLLIREMKEEDAIHVRELSAQLGYDLSLAETVDQIKRVLHAKDNAAFVVLHENNIIAWMHVFLALRIETKPFVEIGGLVVDEKYRNHGIGKSLVHHAITWCREKSIKILRVRSNTKRQDAHKFYNASGFSISKEQKIFELEIK